MESPTTGPTHIVSTQEHTSLLWCLTPCLYQRITGNPQCTQYFSLFQWRRIYWNRCTWNVPTSPTHRFCNSTLLHVTISTQSQMGTLVRLLTFLLGYSILCYVCRSKNYTRDYKVSKAKEYSHSHTVPRWSIIRSNPVTKEACSIKPPDWRGGSRYLRGKKIEQFPGLEVGFRYKKHI